MKFFTLVVGVSVAIIALLQWWVAHNKLRLDLFDRRYKVYEATKTFVNLLALGSIFTDEELFKFNAATLDAEFLFDSDVVQYLTQLLNRAVDIRMTRSLLETTQVGDSERESKYQVDLRWTRDQLAVIRKTFAPFLGFTNIKSRFIPSLMNKKHLAREWLYFLGLRKSGSRSYASRFESMRTSFLAWRSLISISLDPIGFRGPKVLR
jgi:hypothetical protein